MPNTSGSLSGLEIALTTARLGPYRSATTDLDAAIALYEWNSRLSGQLFVLIGHLEVVLRNALDRELLKSHLGGAGDSWLNDASVLRRGEINDIAKARTRRLDKRKADDHDGIISELSFSFWKYLLSAKYEATLWTPYLRHAFPRLRGSPAQVRNALDRQHILRNRIAHHEPIFQRLLERYRSDTLRLLSWIDRDTQRWVKSATLSTVETIGSRPPYDWSPTP